MYFKYDFHSAEILYISNETEKASAVEETEADKKMEP